MRPKKIPIIGITTDFEPARAGGPEATQFIRSRYVRAVEQAGALPLLLPIMPITADRALLDALLDAVHGLVISGSGPDLDPGLYGEPPLPGSRLMSPERASFELGVVRAALASDLPVLGICGGLQVLNIAGGGSLYQDLPTQVAGALAHRPAAGAEEALHEIEVKPKTRLADLLPRRLRVNTSHHQAVKAVAPGFIVNAVADDGVVEGLEHPGRRFVLGVQWHPEAMAPEQRRLFEALVDASRRR